MMSRRLGIAGLLVAAVGCGGGGGASQSGGTSGGAGTKGTGGIFGFGGTPGLGGATPTGGAPGSDAGTAAVPPTCGNQVIEGTELCDGARGCPGGQVCSDGCDACLPGPARPPQTLGLIGAALAAGKIDYPTSLLLRGEALVGDERLPPEYDGDFTLAEDTALFVELNSVWNSLTPAQQQMLLPYYVRPNDPQSVWSQPQLFADGPADLPPPIECPQNPDTGTADWRYTASPAGHFVVWSCGSGDSSVDPYAAQRAVAAGVADSLWDLETPGLGVPLADANSDGPAPTTLTDIYLLRTNQCRYRNGQCNDISGPALAAASPALPCGGSPATSSGFLMLRLERVPASASGDLGELTSDLAHELFHVISYGRNLQGQGGLCGGGVAQPASGSWLTEASGVWAEWAYVPADNPAYRTDEFAAFQTRYPFRDSLLDANATGVTSSGEQVQYSPAYEAFGYPVSFSADTSGKPDGFAAFWRSGTAGATNPRALDDALDASFDYANHFRDFAVRAVNVMLPGDPISPMFNSLDDAIKTGVKPHFLPTAALPWTNGEDWPLGVVLKPLAFQVQTWTVPDEIRWVQIDASGVSGSAHLALDALAHDKAADTWTRRRPDAPVWTFCRDDMGDDIDTFDLVVSNFGHHQEDKIDDSQAVVRTAAVCPAYLTGFIHSVRTVTQHDEVTGETVDHNERQIDNWTFSAPTGGTTPQTLMFNAGWNGTYERHDSTLTPLTGPCQAGVAIEQTLDASGGGAGTTPLVFVSLGPMGYALDLAGVPTGSYQAQEVNAYDTCDGQHGSTDSMVEEQDPYGTVAGYVTLTPSMDDPDHFVGQSTVLHSVQPDTGGMETIDWVVNWDVTLGRHN